jgi:hypothetical protein
VLKISASENNRSSTSSPGVIANLHVADVYPPLDGYSVPADAGIVIPASAGKLYPSRGGYTSATCKLAMTPDDDVDERLFSEAEILSTGQPLKFSVKKFKE